MTASAPSTSSSATGARVAIRKLSRTYGRGANLVRALDPIDLDIPSSSFFTVLGPSGCGKSTLLNMIAGFDRPDSGTITVDDVPVSKPSGDRGVVFQDGAALFPWLTVAQNIAYGLKSASRPRDEIVARVDAILALIRLSAFSDHYPHQLSGGMRQLVAIARVLVMEPKLLLMDEPFAALDAITRLHLQQRLIEIWQRTQITVFFITHSVDEAILLSDEVAIMSRRPGTLRERLTIDISRPRSITSPAFNALKEKALASLASDQPFESEFP